MEHLNERSIHGILLNEKIYDVIVRGLGTQPHPIARWAHFYCGNKRIFDRIRTKLVISKVNVIVQQRK